MFKVTFLHGHKLVGKFVPPTCSTFSTSPPSSGNTIRHGVWKKGRIASGQAKPLQCLVILALLTFCEVGSPTGNMVECTSTIPITLGKWNSQIGLCRHWTHNAPIQTTNPTERILGLSSCGEAFEAAMESGDLGKTPMGNECLGNAPLEVWEFEDGYISENYSCLRPDGWCHPWYGKPRWRVSVETDSPTINTPRRTRFLNQISIANLLKFSVLATKWNLGLWKYARSFLTLQRIWKMVLYL